MVVAQKLVDRDGADGGGGEERQCEGEVEGAHGAEIWLDLVELGRERDTRGVEQKGMRFLAPKWRQSGITGWRERFT